MLRLRGRLQRGGEERPHRICGEPLDNPVSALGYPAFLDELKKSGFRSGQNLTIETLDTYQDSQRVFAETTDLLRSNVELLVVVGSEIGLQAAMAASHHSDCHVGH